MHGRLTAEIARFEKYREGYEWCRTILLGGWGQRDILRAQRFAHWYAHSDWDDPNAALRDWIDEMETPQI